MGKFRAKFRPVENANVATFAHDKNSRAVSIQSAEPGDMITMLGEHDHIILVYQIEYQNFIHTILHYVHAMAWPTDGEYGHGVRYGKIEIIDSHMPLAEQKWIEVEKTGTENYTFQRAQNSRTELRRLNWF